MKHAIWVIFWHYESDKAVKLQTHIVACATKKEATARAKTIRAIRTEGYRTSVTGPIRFNASNGD